MEHIFSEYTISISELKRNPAAIVREAHGRSVAVLNHNKPAFYIVAPEVYESMIENTYSSLVVSHIQERKAAGSRAVDVDITDL
jgi:antitoxin StbD